MTIRLKVPHNPDDQMFFDIWQIDLSKDYTTNLVLHPMRFDETDASFEEAQDAIYKTAVVVQGEVDVFFWSYETPYTAKI